MAAVPGHTTVTIDVSTQLTKALFDRGDLPGALKLYRIALRDTIRVLEAVQGRHYDLNVADHDVTTQWRHDKEKAEVRAYMANILKLITQS